MRFCTVTAFFVATPASKERGRLLRSLREQAGWSRKRLHEATGRPESTLRRWETGGIPLAALKDAAKCFGQFDHTVRIVIEPRSAREEEL